jgi:molecular chaperone DnaJ
MTELYDILKVSKNASNDDIRKSYKKLAMECHPDKTQGDKHKAEHFKKINEAYSVLSDQKKRDMYDKFGTVDMAGHGGMPSDLNDIFGQMFGGGMPGGMPGFSFVFSNEGGPGGQGGPDIGLGDIFGQMFGGGDNHHNVEKIDVPLSLSEIHHGTTKKIEFEILDMCQKCQGSGACDPSHVIKCMTCKGEGNVARHLNPFMVTMVKCDSCSGTGSIIKNNKFCTSCKGEKTQYSKKNFEINIPKGIPNHHEVRVQNKGSWNSKTKQYGSMLFHFTYVIPDGYSLHGHDLHFKLNIGFDELLCGFEKNVVIYNETYQVVSKSYFNPNKIHEIQNKGLYDSRKGKYGNFVIDFNVQFDDNTRIAKYADVFQKVFKKKVIEEQQGDLVISVN